MQTLMLAIHEMTKLSYIKTQYSSYFFWHR